MRKGVKSFDEWNVYPKVLVIEIGHLDETIIYDIIKDRYNYYDTQFVNNIYMFLNKLYKFIYFNFRNIK